MTDVWDLPELSGKDVYVIARCPACGSQRWWRARWLKTPPHYDAGKCWTCGEPWTARPVRLLNERAE